jgi:hypothetical protein
LINLSAARAAGRGFLDGLSHGVAAIEQRVSRMATSVGNKLPVYRVTAFLSLPGLVRERTRHPGVQSANQVVSNPATRPKVMPSSRPISSSLYVETRPATDARAEIARALEELRLSSIPLEDVEQIEALVDSLIEHSQDPEVLVDLLAAISLRATTVAAIVKDYTRLRRLAEVHAP